MKIEENLQILLNEHISKAAYIIDAEEKIIAYNEAGENYIPEISNNASIFELIEQEVAQQIRELFLDSVLTGKTNKKEITVNATNTSSRFEIICIALPLETKSLFLLTIGKIQDRVTRDGNKRFVFYTSEVEAFVKDEDILRIINSVKSSYPFTFIGKSKFQKDIDNIDAAFWIKDQTGKFSIVNQRYANSLGLRVSQIEGQYEKDLVPKYMLKLNRTIDTYILETSNSVIVERENPSSLKAQKEKIEILEFPICDIDNNVVAIVGFSRLKTESENEDNNVSDTLRKVIENLDENCLLLDDKEIIKSVSNEFLKLFKISDGLSLIEKRIDELFGLEILDEIKGLKNTGQNEKIVTDFNARFNNKSEKLTLILRKIRTRKGNVSGSIVILKTSEEKLTKDFSDKMYDAIMQNSPEAMFVYDIENLRFLEVNNAALKLYGYSREEFLSMDLTDLYAPEDIQTLLDSSNTRTMSGDFTGPWRHKKKDGDSILVELSKTALDYRGRKSHLNLVRDVSQRLEKEKSLQMFKAVFENSGDVIVNTDMDGFIEFVNEKAVKVLGYSKKEFETLSFLSLVTDEYRASISTDVLHSGEKNTIVREIELKKASGDPLGSVLHATPIFNYKGELDSFNMVVKIDEEDYPRYSSEEIVEISKSSDFDASFLSNVFHEILTPINVIIGFVRELTDSIEKPTEDQNEATSIINENQKLLLQLMDNAVEYSALVQGKALLRTEEILFTDLIDDLKSNIKKTGEENNVEFAYGKISSSLKFETDRQKILSLLTLFFKYAIQLTKEQKIYLSAYMFGDDKCIISVKDTRKSITDGLLKGLRDILNNDENEVRKSYGFSRFTVKLTQELVKLLKIQNEALLKGGEPVEFGLVLPISIAGSGKNEFELESTSLKEKVKIKEEMEIQTKKEIEEKDLQQMTIDELEGKIEENLEEKVEHLIEQTADTKHHLKKIDEPERQVIKEAQTQPVEPMKAVEEFVPSKEQPVAHPIFQDSSSINVNVNLQPSEQKEQTHRQVEVIPVREEIAVPIERKGIDLSEFSCLYVEDQVDSQILFKVQMKDLKSVEFATSFEKAVPFLKNKTFDFIVMDINLQGEYNGLDALRIIQKMPGYEKIPIIAVTAYVLPGDREKFIAAGFRDFISKPVLREKLLDVLKGIF